MSTISWGKEVEFWNEVVVKIFNDPAKVEDKNILSKIKNISDPAPL